jgi:hypothetical protein
MSFSFSLLSSVVECDNLLTIAQFELKELEAQKTNADIRQDRTDISTQRNQIAISVARAELNGVEAALLTVTNPEVVKTLTNKKTKLENRIENLEVDLTERGALQLLKMEMSLAQLNATIEATQDFITQLNARKAELAVNA